MASLSSQEAVIDEILTRAVGSFIDPDNSFRNKLLAKARGEYKQDIIIKFGVDPTRPDIHLGHAVILRKLRKLQDLGCKVVFLVGDFTALIGDPTGKSKVRPEIDQEVVNHNMQTYLEQVDNILRTDPGVFSWIRNSDWFTSVTDVLPQPGAKVDFNIRKGMRKVKVSFPAASFIGKAAIFEKTRMQAHIEKAPVKGGEIQVFTLINLLSTLRSITYSQLIGRDMFQERIKNGAELYMHEMLYPVLQGVDSSVLAKIYSSCDLEVGGTDQHFNMLLGRDVMARAGQEPQAVLSFEILQGTNGVEKMSKSLDNYIGITDEPADMYGKVMSIPDSAIAHYFELATYMPLAEVEEVKSELTKGGSPYELKKRLAHEIVSTYHGEEEAAAAGRAFTRTFSEGKVPEDVPQVTAPFGTPLVDLLQQAKLVASTSDWRRLVEQGAIRNATTDEKITDIGATFDQDIVLKIGKRRFLRLKGE